MRNSRDNLLWRDGLGGAEMKRRIADCRGRLRRNRAAQRIEGRAAGPVADSHAGEGEIEATPATGEALAEQVEEASALT